MSQHSAIYVGTVAHVRRGPKANAFRYRQFMLYLDLDELEQLKLGRIFGVERAAPLSFHRSDYRGDPSRSLKQVVLDDVERELGERPTGPVRLLTHVRSFGYVFDPVSLYYCFDADGETLRAIVAEITNTPWQERHAYVLRANGDGAVSEFDKDFHVSPFFPMEQRYDWRLSAPGASLKVEMKNHEAGKEVFRANLKLSRRPLTRRALWRLALLRPLMSWRMHVAIYWQALKLWLKRVPVSDHPKLLQSKQAASGCPHKEISR